MASNLWLTLAVRVSHPRKTKSFIFSCPFKAKTASFYPVRIYFTLTTKKVFYFFYFAESSSFKSQSDGNLHFVLQACQLSIKGEISSNYRNNTHITAQSNDNYGNIDDVIDSCYGLLWIIFSHSMCFRW